MKFVPLNKYLLVEDVSSQTEETGFIVPDEMKVADGPYTRVRFLDAAHDCDAVFNQLPSRERDLIVQSHMLETVKDGGNEFLIIHQNNVVGLLIGEENGD